MSVRPLRKEGDRNPRTAEEAKALVKHVESLFMPWNRCARRRVHRRLRGAFRDGAGVSRSRSVARLLHRAQPQAEGLSAQEKLPHADERHHHQRLGRRMAGRRERHRHAGLRRRSLDHARRQNRGQQRTRQPRTASPTFCADLIGARLASRDPYLDERVPRIFLRVATFG
jgi:hypothetical protein